MEKEDIYNVTFGAPFIGDKDMKKFLENHEMDKNMLHFCNNGDIVPSILSIR